MIKFYKLAKYSDNKIGFMREEGYFLPNNYDMELVVYRNEDKEGKRWFVVECSSGCAVGVGESKNRAIENFNNNVYTMGLDSIHRAIDRSIQLYGRTPDHGIMEVF